MESVPDSKGMEELRGSSIRALRLKDSSFQLHHDFEASTNGSSSCRSINLAPPSPISPLQDSPENTYSLPSSSPLNRGHLRSSTSFSRLAPPSISRAQSMPGFNSTGHILPPFSQAPASPRNSSSRIRSPRKPVDEVFISLPNRNFRSFSAIAPLASSKDEQMPRAFDRSSSPTPLNNNGTSRLRRPASPRYISSQNSPNVTISSTSPLISSPTTNSPRLNDTCLGTSYCYTGSLSYPGSFSSFSIPSTPTSARSRSPSISSLETIPDSPDAEEAALKAERLAQLQVVATSADNSYDSRSKNSQDINGGRLRSAGVGFNRDKRKRWSVCGAERRGDLNLDTIWED